MAEAAFDLRWPDARAAAMLVGELDICGRSLLAESARAGGRAARHQPDGRSSDVPAVRPVVLSGGELFGVPETRGWSASVSAPIGSALATLRATGLGGPLYLEREAAFGGRWLTGPDTEIETELRALCVGASGLRDRWTAALDVGITRRVLGRILLASRCSNVTRSGIRGSPVASYSCFGVALVLPGLAVQAGVRTESDLATSTMIGLEVALTDWISLRAGADTAPGRMGVGLGVGEGAASTRPRVDIAWQWHPQLGGSSFASVSFVF